MKAPEFTAEDHLVWKVLFDRQTALLHRRAAAPFAAGLSTLGLTRDAAPDLEQLAERLRRFSGWELVPASGRVDDRTYLSLLGQRRIPVARSLRPMSSFDYIAGPDLFHDIFAHLPMLLNPAWAAWLEHFGQIARRHLHDTQAVEQLTRLFVRTAEFGLLQEGDSLRVIGAALISSSAELHHCLGDAATRLPLDVDVALEDEIVRNGFQPRYFILPDLEQLADATAELAVRLSAGVTPAADDAENMVPVPLKHLPGAQRR